MPVEFIGIAHTSDYSETNARSGPVIQPEYLRQLARVHEESGFDRVLVAHSSSSPDGFTVTEEVLNATSRLGVLLAHRPGFVAPTVAARKFATVDAFHPGRIALHVITGGDDGDQARDGDFADKPARYRRTDEFLDIVEREWSAAARFDYDGEFYKVRGALSKATGAAGNSTALVGSYEQVAESLLDYVAIGATTLLIRGYDPVGDAAAYANLVRLVHEKVGDDVAGFRAAAVA